MTELQDESKEPNEIQNEEPKRNLKMFLCYPGYSMFVRSDSKVIAFSLCDSHFFLNSENAIQSAKNINTPWIYNIKDPSTIDPDFIGTPFLQHNWTGNFENFTDLTSDKSKGEETVKKRVSAMKEWVAQTVRKMLEEEKETPFKPTENPTIFNHPALKDYNGEIIKTKPTKIKESFWKVLNRK